MRCAPEHSPQGGEAIAEPIHARAYRHPVLPSRVIVRLGGDELAMRALGCAPGMDLGEVARGPRSRPSFTTAALEREPGRAKLVFATATALAKLLRLARTETRRATRALDELGKTLPAPLAGPFYDAAARGLVELGEPASAATLYARARASEPDDPDLLEMVLAGAVTTKVLDEHARRVDYQRFRRLCVARTLAGFPPWASMHAQLRRLAKEAGRDPAAEDIAFVDEILDAPNLEHAAVEFWRRYTPALIEVGKRRRRRILDLFPRGTGDFEIDELWFPIIEATGALDEIDDATAWFDRVCEHIAGPGIGRSRGWHEVGLQRFALLRRLAPRFARPIACAFWRWFDLDLADLALELGVPVRTPAELDMEWWASRAGNARVDATPHAPSCEELLGRPLEHVARDPQLGPLLAASCPWPHWTCEKESQRPGFELAKQLWGSTP